ncbi:MAG: NUDIX hydrolase [Candidatus Baltobacteraceae bacterium]
MDEIPQVTTSATVFEGRVFRVRVDEVRYADARSQRIDVVEHRGSLAIIATTQDDRIVLVRQYRHPLRRMFWEIPAGMSEEREAAVDGALRELREETGYRAQSIRALGSIAVSPGFCNETMDFFHASSLIAGPQNLDDDERIAVASFELEKAQSLVRDGQIADAKTIIALLWMQGSRGELVNAIDR